MQVPRGNCCCSLRTKCFIIGYLNLFATIIVIGAHLLIVAIVSRGFECDVDRQSLQAIDYPWLEPVLLIINLGTHGLYPFPLLLPLYKNELMIPEQPRCYFGMVHLNRIDVIGYIINAIWLKFVISFVTSIHKRDPERMRIFFSLSLIKLVVELMFVSYHQGFYTFFTADNYCFINIMDICLAALFLLIISKHINQLRFEKAQNTRDQPPSYVESIVNGPSSSVGEKKEYSVYIEQNNIGESLQLRDRT